MFEFGQEGANAACAWFCSTPRGLGWAGRDSRSSHGHRSFEGFQDWAIPPGRLKLGGISTTFKGALIFVGTVLTGDWRFSGQNQFSNSSKYWI